MTRNRAIHKSMNRLLKASSFAVLGVVILAAQVATGQNASVATPTFSPASGTYSAKQSVTIKTSTPSSTIHYTTDGTTPTAKSPVYSEPISVSTSAIIEAIAVSNGLTNSEVGSAEYTFANSSAPKCSGMSLGVNASLNGFVPFPATNAWNVNIASAPVDPNSEAIVTASGFAGEHLHPDFGSEDYYGIPYVVVDSSTTPAVPIDVIDYADESDVVAAPYPANAPIEGLPADCTGWPDTYVGDSHALVIDRAKCELYETYNTHRCNGKMASSSETIWDLADYESRPWGWTSADAAGLPIFPGLIRYDEIASGAIKHAIRFTLPFTKNDQNGGYFIGAATHASGTLWGTNNVIGMKIRLKASFDISGYSKVNQIILTAMQQYGMILADNGSYFFFQGVSDPRFDDNDLVLLEGISSSNFEVVKTTPEFPGYDSATAPTGDAPTIESFEASATTVTPGKSVTLTYKAKNDSYDFIDVLGPVKGGSVTVTPAQTTTYTLHSTNAYGSTASEAITVTVALPAASKPAFSPAAGTFASSQTVKITSATPSAVIHYTTNGSTPTSSSPVYSAPFTVSSSETVDAIAVASGYSASATATAEYTITTPAATPTFKPAAGSFTAAQSVVITTTTPNATIHYTTNGSTPTVNSAVYSSAVAVGANETIKAIAVASGHATSATGSAAYTITLPAAAPSFSPAPGTYAVGQTVTISSKTPSSTIHYTTNGSTPTVNSAVYSKPITLSANTKFSAIAIASGYSSSAAENASYTVATTAATPTFSPAAGTYSASQTVTLKTGTTSSGIYYTTDGSTPTAKSTLYAGPISVASSETLKAVAIAPGMSASSTAAAAYVIEAPAATPSFSPGACSYTSAQTVTITSATPSAAIYYTTDGSIPTTKSTLYQAPITVSSSQTLNAIAVAKNDANSSVATAAYTITSGSPFSIITPVTCLSAISIGQPIPISPAPIAPVTTVHATATAF